MLQSCSLPAEAALNWQLWICVWLRLAGALSLTGCRVCSTQGVTPVAACSAGSTLQLSCHNNQHLGLARLCRKNRESWRSRLPSPAWRMARQGRAPVSSSPCHAPSLVFHQSPAKTAAVAFPTQTWQEGRSSVFPAAFWPAHIPALSSSRADLAASFANCSERVTFLDLPRFCCLRFWKR